MLCKIFEQVIWLPSYAYFNKLYGHASWTGPIQFKEYAPFEVLSLNPRLTKGVVATPLRLSPVALKR